MTVTVYSKPACKYSVKAKDLLERLGYVYNEKLVTKDISLEEFFKELGKTVRTIPQIVIDGKHIGSYNELTEYFADQGKINYKGDLIE